MTTARKNSASSSSTTSPRSSTPSRPRCATRVSTSSRRPTGGCALEPRPGAHPDLIVLDVMLPDLDGLEVTRRLRSDGLQVPVLFLTARDALEDKVAGLTVGGDDYVTKPFALAEIVARVHAILRRIRRRGRGRGHPALRRPRARRERPRGDPRRPADPAHRHRVQPPALLHAQPAPRAVQVPDPRPRLALRLRRRRQRGRDLRQLPAQEDQPVGPPLSTPSGWSATRSRERGRRTRCRSGPASSSPSGGHRSSALAVADVVIYSAPAASLLNHGRPAARPGAAAGSTGPGSGRDARRLFTGAEGFPGPGLAGRGRGAADLERPTSP